MNEDDEDDDDLVALSSTGQHGAMTRNYFIHARDNSQRLTPKGHHAGFSPILLLQ
jgi:hypothetical protein